MFHRSLIGVALIVLFGQLSFAIDFSTETILTGKNIKNEKIFVIRYYEEGQWHVRDVVQHADGWQDLISSKTYSDLESGQQAQSVLTSTYSEIKNMSQIENLSEPEIQLQGAAIWATIQSWNQDWEEKYAQWLTTEVDTQFFAKYKIATDCADVAYSARWIFARINGLPAANHLNGTVLFTNQSLRSEWQNLPTAKNWYEDKRFLASLNYLLELTYTHTLMRDSYPVEIAPGKFLPGTHFLNLHEASGHTRLVHEVNLLPGKIPLLILQSTTPRKVRELNESLFWDEKPPIQGTSGFLKILWPVVHGGQYRLMKPSEMPSYSLDQYKPDFIRSKDVNFGQEVMLRLQPQLDLFQILQSGLNDLKKALQMREEVVQEGYLACGHNSCPEGSGGYENWSTPSRDQQLMTLIRQIRLVPALGFKNPDREKLELFLKAEMAHVYLTLNGQDFTLKQILLVWDIELYSSDPNDEPGLRWALDGPSVFSRIKNILKVGFENRRHKMDYVSDGKMRKYGALLIRFCQNSQAQDCDQLRQNFNTPLEISAEIKTVNEWLAQTFWLNADPLQTKANQWGALQNKSLFQDLDGLVEFQVSKDGIGLTKDFAGVVRIGPMTSQGIQETALPADFSWIALDNTLSVGYAVRDFQILRYDFLKQSSQILQIPIQKTEQVLRPASDELILIGGSQVVRLSAQAGALQITWQGAFKTILSTQSYFILIVEGLSGWQYLDLQQTEAQLTPVIGTTAEVLSHAQFSFQNKETYIFRNAENFRSYWAVRKTTGQSTAFDFDGSVASWSEGLTQAVVNRVGENNAFLLTIDADFKMIRSEKVGDYAIPIGSRLIIYTNSFAEIKQAQFYGEKLEFSKLLQDEDSAWSSMGLTWMSTLLKNKKMRIRSLDGKQIYYEGPINHPLGNNSVPQWGVFPSSSVIFIKSLKDPMGPSLLAFNDFGPTENTDYQYVNFFKFDRGFVQATDGRLFWVDLRL